MAKRPSPGLTLGMLTLLTALLQLGPLYWSGMGHLLAALAVLPLALATALRPCRCNWTFFSIALLLGLISPSTLFVFLTTTAPLGLMLGLLEDRPTWLGVAGAAALLTAGMLVMPGLAGEFPWGGMERAWPRPAVVAADLSFAIAYAALWQALFQRIWHRIGPNLRYNSDQRRDDLAGGR